MASFSEFTAIISTSAQSTDAITWAGTAFAIVYVILAMRLSRWCWIAGTISSLLFVFIYIKANLYYEAVLNLVYAALGVYGWISWRNRTNEDDAKIHSVSFRALASGIIASTAAGIILGSAAHHLLKVEFAYADALLSTFSIFATVLTARKILENWIFWILIDALSSYVYFLKGPSMYLVGLLFIFYTFMALSGYISWKKKLKV